MVAINSIPQQEVAKGNGQRELALAIPITLSKEVAKKPAPSTPAGASTKLISLIILLSSLIKLKRLADVSTSPKFIKISS
jgi:hypothetical protein